jgi:hypothetical protein
LREGGQLDATVQRVSFAGARREIAVRTRSGVTVEVHSYADVAPTVGSMVGLVIPTEAVRALPVA